MATRITLPELEAITRYRDLIEGELANDVIDYGSEPCLRAIHVVARAGETNIARMLLEKKANPNFCTSKGLSPLHYGVLSGKVAMVRLLLLFGAQVNHQSTRDGRTALFTAAEKGHLEVVKFLLEHGANSSMRTFNGELPRDAAFENGYCQIEAILEDHEKRQCRRLKQQRATSDYDIAAYLLGGATNDPFLEMTRSINELFPKVNTVKRRQSVDVASTASSSGTCSSSSGGESSSESLVSTATTTTTASGFTRSETFCAAPPIYEDIEFQPTIEQHEPPIIDRLWDRPPSYDDIVSSSSKRKASKSNQTMLPSRNEVCSTSHESNDSDDTPSLHGFLCSDKDLLLADDKDTTALLWNDQQSS